ncbi:hypothetical protein SAY86_028212 [Trapa natans]|uniref:Small RNA 2'-O-methyltransferase n=1 Tax=Trapa natans TaxID=22666 RepID=A0AAN7RDJ0_TRANT|nr:hypothetical protein SAY86_028212 [Trapa natans]
MEGEGVADARKNTITPKAVINSKFGIKASYVVEEVVEPSQDGCPGLSIPGLSVPGFSIPQKGPSSYRCRLELPDFSVVSGTFRKKKDAEQDAAQKAVDKLGIRPSKGKPTLEEASEELVSRISYLFSDEFIQIQHPMSGHLRATLRREGDHCGLFPISVIAACDGKASSLCKQIDPKVESNPSLALSFIKLAASKLSGSLSSPDEKLWIKRLNPYPQDILESPIDQESCHPEVTTVHALYIPSLMEEPVEPINFDVLPSGYYMDIIAEKLRISNASDLLISRPIGRASSETRLYYAAPEMYWSEASSSLEIAESCKDSINVRATYLSGQDIYGNAILAAVGYTWKSKDLSVEDISILSYYRMLINKTPAGAYKLSRGAVITATLPLAFTTKTNWRGLLPRDILNTFCRQHRLAEPTFNTSIVQIKSSSELSGPPKELRTMKPANETEEAEATFSTSTIDESAESGSAYLCEVKTSFELSGLSKKLRTMKPENETGQADASFSTSNIEESAESGSNYQCEVKILSKMQEVILVCSPKESFKRQNDCIQTAALKVLSWLNMYFLDMKAEKAISSTNTLDITFNPKHLHEEFKLCSSIHGYQQRNIQEVNNKICQVNIEGPDSGISPTPGSLVSITYSVSLVPDDGHAKELLESADVFEFEMGTGAVISYLEVAVAQMSVGQSACFFIGIPDQELILAASDDFARINSLLNSNPCCLEYFVKLMHITEPLEDGMEQAFFSPPLSKQRVEYAVGRIRQSDATSLVDFGCGSGSLLESLLDYATGLEKIVGVDISVKSLIRAAKVLHSKLSKDSSTIKSAVLYDGSIIELDSRLCGFDMGTCLEVIEHMQEEQAHLFGDIVLGSFRPKTLIVSTPNYEYNVILRGSSAPNQEEDADEKSQAGGQSFKFRNHDHKFEWTRRQFESWASKLATKHNYMVEFSGVGGSHDIEPGFASQIAVFRMEPPPHSIPGDSPVSSAEGVIHRCNVVWEWNPSS